MQVYTFSTKNRVVAALAGLVVLGAGAALMLVGLALLAGLAVAGGVIGTGLLAYRAIRGQRNPPLERTSASGDLDPTLEVFPDARRLDPPPNESSRRIEAE